MATSQELTQRIADLEEGIASGVTRVGYGSNYAEYRSLDEMRGILSDLKNELAGLPKRKTQRVAISKGY